MIHSGVGREMLSFNPDFRTFHFGTAVTQQNLSCEITEMLDAWLFTGGTSSYLPPYEKPPNDVSIPGLGDSI